MGGAESAGNGLSSHLMKHEMVHTRIYIFEMKCMRNKREYFPIARVKDGREAHYRDPIVDVGLK